MAPFEFGSWRLSLGASNRDRSRRFAFSWCKSQVAVSADHESDRSPIVEKCEPGDQLSHPLDRLRGSGRPVLELLRSDIGIESAGAHDDQGSSERLPCAPTVETCGIRIQEPARTIPPDREICAQPVARE